MSSGVTLGGGVWWGVAGVSAEVVAGVAAVDEPEPCKPGGFMGPSKAAWSWASVQGFAMGRPSLPESTGTE